jgi:tripartite-type tricarboxylate transporter receptor subunit TctC
VRALGVSTMTRSPSAPDIPSIAEAGVPGFKAAAWGLIVAPAGTPKQIVTQLHAEMKRVAGLPSLQGQIIKLGMIPAGGGSPEELRDFIASEIARWAKVVHQAGLAGSE